MSYELKNFKLPQNYYSGLSSKKSQTITLKIDIIETCPKTKWLDIGLIYGNSIVGNGTTNVISCNI